MNLPDPIAAACQPLFVAAPIDRAMSSLRGGGAGPASLVEEVLSNPAMANRPDLAAGLWLYADDLERSHVISQSLPDHTGAFWHGIVHRREGDYPNAQYWMRRAAGHPLLRSNPELDPAGLVDAVARATEDSPELVVRQRREWAALFEWCANNP